MGRVIIEGITEENKVFHPRNWVDRLGSMLGMFGSDHRLRYSPLVQPQVIDGTPCLVIDRALQETNALCFQFLMDFAKANRLRTHDDLGALPRTENAA